MANTPTREHREAAVDALLGIEFANESHLKAATVLVSAAICDAEQRGYERGREAEMAEVVDYLYSSGAAGSARAIELGSHLAKEE